MYTIATSVTGEVVFISPASTTATPRGGDSVFIGLLKIQKIISKLQIVKKYVSLGDCLRDDLERLKRGEPLRIGLVNLLRGTSRFFVVIVTDKVRSLATSKLSIQRERRSAIVCIAHNG